MPEQLEQINTPSPINEMEFNTDQKKQLEAPISKDSWHERKGPKDKFGNRIYLKYINTFNLYDTANTIFGHGGWQRTETESKCIQEDQGKDCIVAYIAKVTIKVWNGKEWITRTGVDGGDAKDSSLAKAHANALKKAETGATKRAFYAFGYPLGLALYFDDDKGKKTNPHIEGGKKTRPQTESKPPERFTSEGTKVAGIGWYELKEHLIKNCEAHDDLTGSELGTALKLFLKPYTFGAEALMNMQQINQETKKDRYEWVQGANDKVLEALDMLGNTDPQDPLDDPDVMITDENIPF